MPLLELRDISKAIGGLLILNRLSFSLEAGEALGILGPNGAGKTTTLNVISGDVPPTSGRVLLDGQDITALPAHRRSRLGIGRTYQIPRPFVGMSVYENVLVGAMYGHKPVGKREAAAVCREVLELTGLLDKRDVLAGKLRLLDRKRLELARALATRPRLLLLDEVGGGLTEPEVQELLKIIAAIRRRGVTLIWIEHIVHALASAVDRVLAMNFGSKLAEGLPREVLASQAFQEIYLGVE
ncbi:MAG: ABC transporter ATP-binding protein [Anaerolineales bacterium]|nr:ABC transporter ATP-binding protein [Anaerolineales bacterium]